MTASPTALLTPTRLQLARFRLRDWFVEKIGWLMESLHVPAKIREFEYVDQASNEAVYLSTGTRYSVLHVGSKRFFFDRLTGRFDGTGTSLEERVVTGLQLLD